MRNITQQHQHHFSLRSRGRSRRKSAHTDTTAHTARHEQHASQQTHADHSAVRLVATVADGTNLGQSWSQTAQRHTRSRSQTRRRWTAAWTRWDAPRLGCSWPSCQVEVSAVAGQDTVPYSVRVPRCTPCAQWARRRCTRQPRSLSTARCKRGVPVVVSAAAAVASWLRTSRASERVSRVVTVWTASVPSPLPTCTASSSRHRGHGELWRASKGTTHSGCVPSATAWRACVLAGTSPRGVWQWVTCSGRVPAAQEHMIDRWSRHYLRYRVLKDRIEAYLADPASRVGAVTRSR